MFHYITVCFEKYATFSGRAQRAEYWSFYLFTLIVSSVLQAADETGVVLSGIFSLATIVPSFAVTVRRLHDTNRTAWWLLLTLLPIIGWIWLIVLLIFDSTPGSNQYGPNPKGVGAEPTPASQSHSEM